MRYEASDVLSAEETLTDAGPADVHIVYKCDAFDAHESMELLQNLVNSAVERLLVKAHRAVGEKGPIMISVEHCQKQRANDMLLGDLRYLKVYVEGHGPCIVTAY
jgi:hypothetical protein